MERFLIAEVAQEVGQGEFRNAVVEAFTRWFEKASAIETILPPAPASAPQPCARPWVGWPGDDNAAEVVEIGIDLVEVEREGSGRCTARAVDELDEVPVGEGGEEQALFESAADGQGFERLEVIRPRQDIGAGLFPNGERAAVDWVAGTVDHSSADMEEDVARHCQAEETEAGEREDNTDDDEQEEREDDQDVSQLVRRCRRRRGSGGAASVNIGSHTTVHSFEV